jgi:hypothetical protein
MKILDMHIEASRDAVLSGMLSAVDLYRSNLSIEYSSNGHGSPAWMIDS